MAGGNYTQLFDKKQWHSHYHYPKRGVGGTRWDADKEDTVLMHNHLDNMIWSIIGVCTVLIMMITTRMRVREKRRQRAAEIGDARSRSAMLDQGEAKEWLPPEVERQRFFELVFPPSSSVVPNILAGIIAGLKFTLSMVVFSGIIYNSDDDGFLMHAFPTGISLNLMSCTSSMLMSTGLSGMNVLVAPQDIPTMLQSQIAGVLSDTIRCPMRLPNTVLACSWISALLFGCLSWLAGRFHAGRIMRSIPTPVVGGFMSATGALAVRSALSMLCSTKFHVMWPTHLEPFESMDTWLHIALGLFSLVCIRYLGTWIKQSGWLRSDSARALVGPFCLLLPLISFYAYLLCQGDPAASIQRLRDKKWVYPIVPKEPVYKFWLDTFPKDHFKYVEWSAFLNGDVLLLMAMLQLLGLLSAVLNVIGATSTLAGASGADLDTELQVLGFQNLVVGALGGTVCYHQLGVSVNMHLDGGSHRLAGLVAAAFVATVFLSGMPVSPYIPRFFLAGIFLNLGLTFMSMNLVEKFNRMDKASYFTMVVIVLVALARDMAWAVGVGMALQMSMSVVLASTGDPIRRHASTDTVASSRLRSVKDRELLRSSYLIQVVHLQGPLFFGVAPQLTLEVEDLIRRAVPRPRHVILNIEQVTVIDDSASQAFLSICRTARKADTQLHFVGAHEWKWLLFRQGVLRDTGNGEGLTLLPQDEDQKAHWFQSFDMALQDCEDDILQEISGGASSPTNARLLNAARHDHLRLTSGMSADLWHQLLSSGHALELAQGDMVYSRGDACGAMYLLTRGDVHIHQPGSEHPLQRVCALALLGMVPMVLELDRHAESAEVATAEGATLVQLSKEHLEQMRQKQPDLYVSFTDLRARALCASAGTSTQESFYDASPSSRLLE